MTTDQPGDLHLPGPMDPARAADQAARDTAALERAGGPRAALPEAFAGVFEFHPATPRRAALHEAVRSAARDFAHELVALCPASAERTLALRAVQTAMHQGNAAIAVHDRTDEVDP